MSISLPQLQERRQQILQDIAAIDHLRRGSLSRQFFKTKAGDSKTKQGPYFVLQGYLQGRKFSERVPADQAPQFATEVANYQRFQQLAEEFVTVTDQLTRRTELDPDSKKNSRAKRTRSASGKPTPSSA